MQEEERVGRVCSCEVCFGCIEGVVVVGEAEEGEVEVLPVEDLLPLEVGHLQNHQQTQQLCERGSTFTKRETALVKTT
jgi:hypothetical protein